MSAGSTLPVGSPDDGSIDDAIDALGGPPTEEIDSAIDTVDVQNDRARANERIKYNLKAALDADLHRITEVRDLARKTGIDPGIIHRNYETVRDAVARKNFDPEALRARAPKLAETLEDPRAARSFKDDIYQLSTLENLLGIPKHIGDGMTVEGDAAIKLAFSAGVAQQELALILASARDQAIDPDSIPRVVELREQLRAAPQGRNFVERSVLGATQNLPMLGVGFAEGAAIASIAEGSAIAAAEAYPPVAPTLPAVLPALRVGGYMLGSADAAFQVEAGFAYDEIIQQLKQRNLPVDYKNAAQIARGIGWANAAIEMIPAAAFLKYFPGLSKLIGRGSRESVRELFRPATPTQAAVEGIKALAAQTVSESVAEGAQRAVTVAGREIATGEAGGTPDFSTIPGEAATETIGALESFWLLGAPGAVSTFAEKLHQSRDSQKRVQHAERLRAVVQSIAASTRAPDELERFAQSASPDDAAVFVPVEAWNAYWKDQAKDPAEVAEVLLGQGAAYSAALASRADLAIPVSKVVARLAPTEHYLRLLPDMRLGPNEMTGREVEELQRGEGPLGEELARLTSLPPPAAPDAEVTAEISRKLQAAGTEPDVADRQAKVWGLFFATQAARLSTARPDAPVTAAELLQRYPEVRIERHGVSDALLPAVDPSNADQDSQRITSEMLRTFPAGDGAPLGQTLLGSAGAPWVQSFLAGTPKTEISRFVDEQGRLSEDGLQRMKLALLHRVFGPPAAGKTLRALTEVSGRAREHLSQAVFSALPQMAQLRGAIEGKLVDQEYDIAPALARVLDFVQHTKKAKTKAQRALDVLDPFSEVILETMAQTGKHGENLAEIINAYADAVLKLPTPDQLTALDASPPDRVELWKRAERVVSSESEGGFPRLGQDIGGGRQPGPERGFISFGQRRIRIGLLEGADLSTFLHESAHFFLEVLQDLATAPDAPQQIVDDYQKILTWLGAESGKPLTRAQHEQFARGFEAYLFEGKAPIPQLAGLFARFRAWLVDIYRSLQRLDVTLTDEVRGVFDRMLVTDEQLLAAESEQAFGPMFAERAEAGVDAATWARYLELADGARAEARRKFDAQLLAEVRREKQQWWDVESDKIRVEVEASVNQRRGVQAKHFLRTGEWIGGEQPAGLEPFKLNRDQLLTRYGPRTVNSLIGSWSRTGIDLDNAAAILGYQSGDEMVKEVLATPTRSAMIEGEVDRRMKAAHGDLLHDGRIGDLAMDAAQNERRGELLLAELRMLTARSGSARNPPPIQVLRSAIAQASARLTFAQLRPEVYRRAAAAASRRAFKAVTKREWETARIEKERQLFAHLQYVAARDARAQAETNAGYLLRMTKDAAQARLGKAGASHQAQVNALLERFEFKTVPLVRLRERESLRAWVEAERAAGREPVVPEQLLDETRHQNWKQLSVEELAGVADTVRNIEHLANTKNRLRLGIKDRDRDELIERALAAIEENVPTKERLALDPDAVPKLGQLSDRAARLDSALVNVEELAAQLDGNNPNGIWAELLVHSITDAEADENGLVVDVIQRLLEKMDAIPKAARDKMQEIVHIKSIGQSFRREALIAVALNVGNESNLRKLMQGYQTTAAGLIPWTAEALDEMLSHLDKEHWDLVQEIWDTIGSFWPKIEEMEMRLTGLPPQKVVPTPVVTRFGVYRGGYYPVIYDSRLSRQGRISEDSDVAGLFDSGYTRAITPHGHTINRVEDFARPIKLSLSLAPSHMVQVAHDLTHRETLVAVYSVLTDSRVQTELVHRLGEPYYHALIARVKRIANNRNTDTIGTWSWDKLLEKGRANFMAAVMGFKASVILQNFANFGPALAQIPPRWYAAGLREFTGGRRATVEWVKSKSGFMRHRAENVDANLRNAFDTFRGRRGTITEIKQFGLKLGAYTDMATAYPLWIGSFRQAEAAGLTAEEALRKADADVRAVLGSSSQISRALIQDGQLWRYLTMFYSFFSAQYNAERRLLRGATESYRAGTLLQDLPGILARQFALVVIPAVLGDLLSGRWPGKDDEDEGVIEWLLLRVFLYATAMVPVLREAAAAITQDRDVKFTPIAALVEPASKAAHAIVDSAQGDLEPEDAAGRVVEAAATAAGLPVAQTEITGGYVRDLVEGDAYPDDPLELATGLLFKAPKGGGR